MHTIEIPDKKIKISMASCIEELSHEEFEYLIFLLIQQHSNAITADQFKMLFVSRLLRIRKSSSYYLMSEDKREHLHDNLDRIITLVDSFFVPDKVDGKDIMALNLYFVKNMLPRIGKLIGPDDALTNVNFREYRDAVNYFHQYQVTKDEEFRNRFIAVLYRLRRRFLYILKMLPDFDGQLRIHYSAKSNPIRLEKRARYIAKIPLHIKLGIELWFDSCNRFLREGSPEIDGLAIDLSILYSGVEESSDPGIGLVGLLYSLSESKVFGELNATDNTNLYDIMARLYQLKLDYDKQSKPKK